MMFGRKRHGGIFNDLKAILGFEFDKLLENRRTADVRLTCFFVEQTRPRQLHAVVFFFIIIAARHDNLEVFVLLQEVLELLFALERLGGHDKRIGSVDAECDVGFHHFLSF